VTPSVGAPAPSAPSFLLNLLEELSFSCSTMNILLVDDSKAMRAMIRRTLLQTGMCDLRVEEAENGSDALAKLASELPDLILSDWSMPEMNGVELLRELRSRGSSVKFGFVTSPGASTAMREKAFEAGAQFVVERPLSVQGFRHLLGG
jgi:two-component system chemotaxis response regulator CheY